MTAAWSRSQGRLGRGSAISGGGLSRATSNRPGPDPRSHWFSWFNGRDPDGLTLSTRGEPAACDAVRGRDARDAFLRSSVVERAAVNRLVVGSTPTAGATQLTTSDRLTP